MTVNSDPSYDEVTSFYPLSLLNLVNHETLDKKWMYPLKALNVFEVMYWFLLVAGIHHYARKSRRMVWYIVACSYILIFFLWLWFYVVVYK